MPKHVIGRQDLRAARSMKRLSQTEVAKELGVSQSEYSRIELGRRDPGGHAIALSELLGITVSEFLDPDSSPPPELKSQKETAPEELKALLVELRLLKKLFDSGSISKDVFDKERLVLLEKHGF